MKHLLLLNFFFACASEIPVLAQDTLYYNSNWRDTTASQASYFRIKVRSAPGWQVTDYFLIGKPQMTGQYSDDSFHVRQGEFVWYDSSGIVNHRCRYVNNKEDGPETYYYASGQVQMTGNNKEDEAHGEWTGYYPSGKISGKAGFKKDKQISGTFYHEDGTRDKTITEFWRESEFPGGLPQWLRFLNKTLRYPDSAVEHDIEGTVVIGFMVSKEGKVDDMKVIQSVNKYLDEEALRVMRQTPDWRPAITGGILSESYKKQPIVFKLQSE
ncbi:MAG TPA: TonB family protein [Puia sp.]|nr:TonB family protein [Puia sp.]